jgi:glutathione synthase/RimK-type ligase-like ATP-grasp enzyme
VTKPVALVTAAAARALDEDLPPLARALEGAGIAHEIVCWDQDVDWSRFAAAVLRSTWDYVPRLDEFLTWAARTSAQTPLLNPLPLIRWNTDKRYLADLGAAGVAIVPSTFVQPGDAAPSSLDAFLAGGAFAEFVVKPCVGAGSRDAARYHRDDHAQSLAHLQRLLADGRTVLLQPYLDRVDADGETALIFIGGAFSHAIRKGPLLRRAESPTSALFAPEDIVARAPDAAERALAERTVAAIAADPRLAASMPLLYLRVDLLRLPDGSPCVLELETTEPSLFFDHAPGAADRFAEALRRRLASA